MRGAHAYSYEYANGYADTNADTNSDLRTNDVRESVLPMCVP